MMLLRKVLTLVPVLLLAACSVAQTTNVTSTPTEQELRGKYVFDSFCGRCHSRLEGEIIVGPSLNGIASQAGDRIDGLDAEEYIRQSILEPDAYIVDGYAEGLMPSTLAEELEPDQLDAVVAYLLTLK